MKTPFSQLSKQLQSIFLTIPVFTPSTANPDAETDQQVVARQERFLKLPKNIRWKLASFDISDKIESIGRKYGFELLRLANITRLVREYYFGEVRLEDFPREIEKRMNVSLLTAQEIARYVKSEIIDWDPYAEFLASLPKLPIREALKKYPTIGEQEISSGYLEIKGRDDIFDGTIRNWINDYILHLGQERHGTIDRTNYLFHSENTKNLTSPEREKLGIILKSFDENLPLSVDTENNEVVLEVSGLRSTPTSHRGLRGEQQTVISDQYQRPASVAKITSQPQRPAKENFIKPYPQSRPESVIKPQQKIRRNVPNIQHPAPSIQKSDATRFLNPYSMPETHEMPQQKEIIESRSGSPLVVKDYVPRQNIPGAESISPRNTAPAKPTSSFFQKPAPQRYIRHPKNIIEPISRSHPEPKIEGNIVDLKGE